MSVYISRVQIENFRNLRQLDVSLSNKSVVVGENKSGKSNFLHALRLILDPDLPDSSRHLQEDDFWDGLESPLENRAEITVSIDLQGFEGIDSLLAILSDFLVEAQPSPTARITYKYAPVPDLGAEGTANTEAKYDFTIYGGDDPTKTFGYQQRKWIPLQVLPALRDAESSLESWRKSPLRPLIDRLRIKKGDLEVAASMMQDATKELVDLAGIKQLGADIEKRLEEMVGEFHSVSPSLGVASTNALRLLRSLRMFVDGELQRPVGNTSLGIANVLYLTLLVLELERKEAAQERAATILAIEEPEAHLHPHLQRLVFRDFLRRESSVLLTTHSPHIVSVSPIHSIVLLRDYSAGEGSKATSTTRAELTEQQAQDLERYLDATRGEMLFARGVVMVEGDTERYVVPTACRSSLDENGISVCSVQGTDFVPYTRLLAEKALGIPHVVVTDGDPYCKEGNERRRGITRAIKLATLGDPDVEPELEDLNSKQQWAELYERLHQYNIFVGEHTLEIDLAIAGNDQQMVATLEELGASPKRLQKFSDSLANAQSPTEDDLSTIMQAIEFFGKGRFAQRLAPKLTPDSAPEYIALAIGRILELVNPPAE